MRRALVAAATAATPVSAVARAAAIVAGSPVWARPSPEGLEVPPVVEPPVPGFWSSPVPGFWSSPDPGYSPVPGSSPGSSPVPGSSGSFSHLASSVRSSVPSKTVSAVTSLPSASNQPRNS